jgi:hypothetical protein
MAGYILILLGLLCLYMNWIIVKNYKLEYQDFEVMKDNYQDFNDDGQKDSLTFPNFITNYESNSTNNSNRSSLVNKQIFFEEKTQNETINNKKEDNNTKENDKEKILNESLDKENNKTNNNNFILSLKKAISDKINNNEEGETVLNKEN